MKHDVAQSVDITIVFSVLVLFGVVAGHLWLDELVSFIRWVASDIVSPAFGLDDLF